LFLLLLPLPLEEAAAAAVETARTVATGLCEGLIEAGAQEHEQHAEGPAERRSSDGGAANAAVDDIDVDAVAALRPRIVFFALGKLFVGFFEWMDEDVSVRFRLSKRERDGERVEQWRRGRDESREKRERQRCPLSLLRERDRSKASASQLLLRSDAARDQHGCVERVTYLR
jgi:hypothetical protein